jgi:hydrogenase maturation protease
MSSADSPVVVIGVGNAWAGDDAAGLLVARMVRECAPAGVAVIEHEGEPTALMDVWKGARLAILVDATQGGGRPGEVRVMEATREALPAALGGASTHAYGLGDAIELARALGRLPERLVVVGIEGATFEAGRAPGPAVTAALHGARERVLALTAT